MQPRIEQKFIFSPANYRLLLEWLKINDFRQIYPDRLVTSIYFDNYSMQSYYDTVEGIVPRRKIRVRGYGTDNLFTPGTVLTFEKKQSSENSRTKQIEKITHELLVDMTSFGTVDSLYGLCRPVCSISYNREYYGLDDFRLTIDRGFTCSLFSGNEVKSCYEEYVFELKTSSDQNLLKLANTLCFPLTRFSKYEKAINTLSNLNPAEVFQPWRD